jgi:cytochrome c-type biogenesis protein CcmH
VIRRLAAIAAAVLCIAAASDPAERLHDPAQEARARAIFRQVRCLVCQNESIDDSEAPLAQDLRRMVREQVASGEDEGEIKRFLTARYGEFVLLRPAFSAGNAALWGAPLAVVGLGIALWLARGRRAAPEAALSDAEVAALAALAKDEPRDMFAPKIGREDRPRVT